MIWLVFGLALADPCAREVVVGRGLVVDSPGVSVTAELDLRLKLRKRKVDGIPSYSVRHVWVDWLWVVRADQGVNATSAVGAGGALCEGEVRAQFGANGSGGQAWTWPFGYAAKKVDACRVRVVLKGTAPARPTVRLTVDGPQPPGPDAPVTGEVEVVGGQDLVIEIPGCLEGG